MVPRYPKRDDLLVGAIQTSAALGAVVLPSFGPNGLDVLLESSDGHANCSSCGRQIVTSLQLSHPAGIPIVKALTDYHRSTGDGSKKMLIILRHVLEELGSLLDGRQVQQSKIQEWPGLVIEISVAHVFKVSQALQWLKHMDVTTQLLECRMLFKVVTTSEDLRNTVPQVVSTCFSHRYGWKIAGKLQEVLLAFFLPPAASANLCAFKKHIQFVKKNLSTLILPLPGHPVSNTQAIPGFVLDKDLVQSRDQCHSGGVRRLKSVLLLSWAGLSSASSAVFSLDSVSKLQEAVSSLSQPPQTCVHTLQAMNIQLLVCADRVPPGAKHRLREAGISVIEMVAEDTLKLLAESCGSYPLEDAASMGLSEDSSVDLGLSFLHIGPKRYLCLQCLQRRDISPVTVALCAPTTGFCRQLEQQIANTLQVLIAWCHEVKGDKECIVAVAGGGAWEMAVIKQLEVCISDQQISCGSPKWIAVRALQKGLLAIPCALLSSSLTSTATRHTALDLHTKALGPPLPVGVDCTEGTLREVHPDWSPWEPYWSQCYLLHSVISLVILLLRVDHVITGHRLRQNNVEEEEDD